MGGYGRMLQEPATSMYGASPLPKREKRELRRSYFKKQATEAKNNDSFHIMNGEETNPTWTRLEEVPHEDGWSDHKTDMSI